MSQNHDIRAVVLDIDQLVLGRFTPQKRYGKRYIDELAESIEKEGQLKPIIVRRARKRSEAPNRGRGYPTA